MLYTFKCCRMETTVYYKGSDPKGPVIKTRKEKAALGKKRKLNFTHIMKQEQDKCCENEPHPSY